MVAYYIAEPARGFKVNIKSVKISVVYAKHIRLKTKRLFILFLVVHLYKTFKPKLVCNVRIFFHLTLAEYCRDKQHCISTYGSCLVELIFVDDKILAEYRQLYSLSYSFEVFPRALKIVLFSETGNSIRTVFLILAGDFHWVKIRADKSL